MTACSINPSDLVTIAGAYASRTTLPFVPGFEGVGFVEEVGPGVTTLHAGDRVLPIGSAGAWQDVKITAARWCFPVAADLSETEAATGYVNPLSACLMLQERELAPGARVAINAAGSAIGRILIRMANAGGVRPIALVRSAVSRSLLVGLDLTRVIVTDEEEPVMALREATGGKGLDLALDAVGGSCGEALALALRAGGPVLHYGLLSGVPLPANLQRRRPDIRLELFWLRQWIHGQSSATIGAHLARVAKLIRSGIGASPIEASYPLRELPEALRHSLRRGRSGKILVTP